MADKKEIKDIVAGVRIDSGSWNTRKPGWIGPLHGKEVDGVRIITYSFDATPDPEGHPNAKNISNIAGNKHQIKAIEHILNSIQKKVNAKKQNVKFVNVSGKEADQADITFFDGEEKDPAKFSFSGYTMSGQPRRSIMINRDCYKPQNDLLDIDYTNYSFGDWGYGMLAHEIGHALGLTHPGIDQGMDPVVAERNKIMPSGRATAQHTGYNKSFTTRDTVMSYNHTGTRVLTDLDLAALEKLLEVPHDTVQAAFAKDPTLKADLKRIRVFWEEQAAQLLQKQIEENPADFQRILFLRRKEAEKLLKDNPFQEQSIQSNPARSEAENLRDAFNLRDAHKNLIQEKIKEILERAPNKEEIEILKEQGKYTEHLIPALETAHMQLIAGRKESEIKALKHKLEAITVSSAFFLHANPAMQSALRAQAAEEHFKENLAVIEALRLPLTEGVTSPEESAIGKALFITDMKQLDASLKMLKAKDGKPTSLGLESMGLLPPPPVILNPDNYHRDSAPSSR